MIAKQMADEKLGDQQFKTAISLIDGAFTGKTIDIKYPPEFWNGLGLKRYNLKH